MATAGPGRRGRGRGGGRGGLARPDAAVGDEGTPSVLAGFNASEDQLAKRRARFGAENDPNVKRLDALKLKRAEDRKAFIAAGLMDDGTPRALADAITVVGTCMTMCPEYNIVERMVDKSIDQLERDPVTGEVDPARCVTKYPRASAGKEPPLPTEVRPPPVLQTTMDYLMRTILPSKPFTQVHAFIRDRARAIRTELEPQRPPAGVTIDVHERSVRFHILALRELVGVEGYDPNEEATLLQKSIFPLLSTYRDVRASGDPAALALLVHEAEFSIYRVLMHLLDAKQKLESAVMAEEIATDERVVLAHRIVAAMGRISLSDPTRRADGLRAFAELVAALARAPFLAACLASTLFEHKRKQVARLIAAYHAQTGSMSLATFGQRFGVDDTAAQVMLSILGFSVGADGTIDVSPGQPVFDLVAARRDPDASVVDIVEGRDENVAPLELDIGSLPAPAMPKVEPVATAPPMAAPTKAPAFAFGQPPSSTPSAFLAASTAAPAPSKPAFSFTAAAAAAPTAPPAAPSLTFTPAPAAPSPAPTPVVVSAAPSFSFTAPTAPPIRPPSPPVLASPPLPPAARAVSPLISTVTPRRPSSRSSAPASPRVATPTKLPKAGPSSERVDSRAKALFERILATELRTNIESIAIEALTTVRGERAARRSELLDAIAESLADRAVELSVRRVAAQAYAAHLLQVKYWRIWCEAMLRSRERKSERRAARRAFGEVLDGVGVGPVEIVRGDADEADEEMVDALAELELDGPIGAGDEGFADALETARGIWLPSTFVQALVGAANRIGLADHRVIVVVPDLCASIVKWYRCKLGVGVDETESVVARRTGSTRISIVDAELAVDDAATLIVFDCRLGQGDLAERLETALAAARGVKYLPDVLVVAWPRADASWDETVAEVESTLGLPRQSRYASLSILVVDPATVNGAFEVECAQLVRSPVLTPALSARVPARVYLTPFVGAWQRRWRLSPGSSIDSQLVLAAVDSLQRVLDIAHRLGGGAVASTRLPRFKARPQQSPHAAIASYIGRVAEDEPEFLLDFVPALQRRPPLANDVLVTAFLEHLGIHALDLCDDFGADQPTLDARLTDELAAFERHLDSIALVPSTPVKEKRKRVSSSEQSVEGPPSPKRLVLTKPAPSSAVAAATLERSALSALLEEIQRARDLLGDASTAASA